MDGFGAVCISRDLLGRAVRRVAGRGGGGQNLASTCVFYTIMYGKIIYLKKILRKVRKAVSKKSTRKAEKSEKSKKS